MALANTYKKYPCVNKSVALRGHTQGCIAYVAQQGERPACNREVGGPNPSVGL